MSPKKKPKPKPKKDPKPSGRTFHIYTKDNKTYVDCVPSTENNQFLYRLWETKAPTPFHDHDLARATKEINDILVRLDRNNKDPERVLSFIQFKNRLLLVWATYDTIGSHDDEDKISRALRLK